MRQKLLVGFTIVVALGVAAFMLPTVRETVVGPLFYRLYNQVVSERDGFNVQHGVSYGNHARHKIDIYRPENSGSDSPVVMFIYGGTWKSGERSFYRFVGAALAARGYTVAIPDYRLFPEVKWPHFLDDVALAYDWLARELADKGRDGGVRTQPQRIVLVGHSAGAHMAAMLAYNPTYIGKHAAGAANRPAGLIGLSGPYVFGPTTDELTKDVFATAQNADDARPIVFASSSSPPSLLIHGEADDVVNLDNSEKLTAALTRYGRRVELKTYPDISHTGIVLAISQPYRDRAPVLEDILEFLKTL